jgi:hypothetical protein
MTDVDDDVLEERIRETGGVPLWRALVGAGSVIGVSFIVTMPFLAAVALVNQLIGVGTPYGGFVVYGPTALGGQYLSAKYVGYPVADRLWLTRAERAYRRGQIDFEDQAGGQ